MARGPCVFGVAAAVVVAGCGSPRLVEASRSDLERPAPAPTESATPSTADDPYCRAAGEIADAAEAGGKAAHEKLVGGFVIDRAEALDLQALLSTGYFQGSIALQMNHDGVLPVDASAIMKSRGPGDPCYEKAIARVRAFAGDLPAIQRAASGIDAPTIAWRDDIDVALAEAKKTKHGAILVFCADWAAACNELRHTFAKPRVIAAVAARYVAIRVDMTEETAAHAAIATAHQVLGVPTIIVLDEAGKTIRQMTQFVDEKALLDVLAR